VVGLEVRLEHGDDRDALAFCQRDVVVDQLDVGIHDRESAVGLAAEKVRGAGRFVVQQLAEVHGIAPDFENMANQVLLWLGHRHQLLRASTLLGIWWRRRGTGGPTTQTT
jgi:hypothetical protein